MNRVFQVAGYRFMVSGERLCAAIDRIEGFKPFLVDDSDYLFSFVEGDMVPTMGEKQYEFAYEDVIGIFGRTDGGYLLTLKPKDEEAFFMWHNDDDGTLQMQGNWSVRLYRFAMWVGLGVMLLPYNVVAIHSSCIVYKNKAVLFLGESGTGKSTHTRLWRENIDGAFLLNDDSPFLRVEDGKVWAYGSPWSGKTPCYRQERYELKGCVRLSQAKENVIKKLSVLQAYAAIHPSCPPEFAYDSKLYDYVSGFINTLLYNVPFYRLACLPDRAASLLSFKTIFANEADSK